MMLGFREWKADLRGRYQVQSLAALVGVTCKGLPATFTSPPFLPRSLS